MFLQLKTLKFVQLRLGFVSCWDVYISVSTLKYYHHQDKLIFLLTEKCNLSDIFLFFYSKIFKVRMTYIISVNLIIKYYFILVKM